MDQKKAIIIGAGPAGLTVALELLRRTDIRPIVIEQSGEVGGLSRTVRYKGNRIDIGGHRFFSKSDRVMQWWFEILPVERPPDGVPEKEDVCEIAYHGRRHTVRGASRRPADPKHDEKVMLVRNRKSRIYFMRKFFDYPIGLSVATLRRLGLSRTLRIGASYLRSAVFPIKNEHNLEEFFINRFGRELYETFFKSYTEKVWGVPCQKISAAWGAQRVKGLSIKKAIAEAVKARFRRNDDLKQKSTETSLIERFLYPKYGPGQMWEEVARQIVELGGEILTNRTVDRVQFNNGLVKSVVTLSTEDGVQGSLEGDYFFSTMPIKDLVRAFGGAVPDEVKRVSEGLSYRDFITVGLLLKQLKVAEDGEHDERLIKDNWIYIQEPDVSLGRLQIFNNWYGSGLNIFAPKTMRCGGRVMLTSSTSRLRNWIE